MMLWSPSNALERAKDTANSLAIVTIVPFVFTWIHCSLLFSRKAKDDKYEDEDEVFVEPNGADRMERPVATAGWTENSYKYQSLNGVDEFRLLPRLIR